MRWPVFVSALLAGLGLLAAPPLSSAQPLELHYINVGWGNSMLVRGPDGTTVLIEAGNTGKGTSEVVPYLKSVGIDPADGLDYVIGGHQHCDHIGGIDEVIQAGYDVRRAHYYNGSTYTSTCVTGWRDAAATTSAGTLTTMPVGQVIPLGAGASITAVAVNGRIIGGGSVTPADENDRSIALLIRHGGFDYLWASDLGGGSADQACTGRSTAQADVETAVVRAISPGGAFPLISSGGIDVLNVNHHGSESSTNANWMNYAQPEVALIGTGAGQSLDWNFPRRDVVENVLLATASCITALPALVLQSEEGAPTGSLTSFLGYSVGDVLVSTDGQSTFTVSANGAVTQGPNEVAHAGLPRTFLLDDQSVDLVPPTVTLLSPSTGSTLSAAVTVSAEATDDRGVASVEFYLDGTLRFTDTVVPWSWTWDTAQSTNGSHTLHVRAIDTAGNHNTSATVTVTVSNRDAVAPSAPTGLTATAGPRGSRSIALRWTASTDNVGVTAYQVWRATALNGTYALIATPTGTTYTDTGLPSGATRFYYVRAVDAAGNASAASNRVSAKVR